MILGYEISLTLPWRLLLRCTKLWDSLTHYVTWECLRMR